MKRITCSIFVSLVNLFVIVSSSNNTTIFNENYVFQFITADLINEKWALNQSFHHVCNIPNEEKEESCKYILKQGFAVKNDIKFIEGETMGKEKRYEFILNDVKFLNDKTLREEEKYDIKLNDGLPITEVRADRILMSACTCPTEPPIYLRNDFGYPTSLQIYVELPFDAH